MPYTLLDGVPFYTKEEIDDNFSEGSVSEERARAQAAEQANATAISNEANRATLEEAALQTQIQDVEGLAEQTSVDLATEITRAQNAEQANANAITTESGRAASAEQANANAIITERTRAIAAEGALTNEILAEATRATTAEQAEVTRAQAAEQALADDIADIESKVPQSASDQNPLTDKAYVDSAIQTATASFRGSYATFAAVPSDYNDYPADGAGNKKPNDNDYLYVRDASDYDPQNPLTGTWRFKYTGSWDIDGKAGWLPEYQVNESVFTPAQIAAIDSGIDTTKVGKIATNETNIGTLQSDVSDLQEDVSDIQDLIPAEATALNQLADKNSVDTAITAAAKLFIAEIRVSIGHGSGGTTYEVTPITPRADVIAAINAGKTIVVRAAWDSSGGSYVYFSFIARNPSGTDILTAYGAEAFQATGTQSQKTYVLATDWTNYNLHELNLQRRLNAGNGIEINNNLVISSPQAGKIYPVAVSGNGLGDYTYNPSVSDIKNNVSSALCFGYRYSTSDDLIFFSKDSSQKLHAYTLAPSDPILRGLVLEHISGNGAQEKNYFALKEFVTVTSNATIAVVGSKAVRVYGNNSISITLQKDSTYNCSGEVTIYNQLSISATLTVNYTNKSGVASTITIPRLQYAKFAYAHPCDGLYCEHTIPLTGTDDQGNAFAYDVVVRD